MTTTGKTIVGDVSQMNAYSLAARLHGETNIAQSDAPVASGEAKPAQPDVHTIGVTRLMDGPYEWKIGAAQPITEEGFKQLLDREATSDFPPKAVLFRKKSVAIKFGDDVKLRLSEQKILEMLKERFNETDFLLPHLTGSEIWRISDGPYKWKIRAAGPITEGSVRRFIDREEWSGFPPNAGKEVLFKDNIVEITFIGDVKFEIDKSKAIEIFKARFKEATFKIVDTDAQPEPRGKGEGVTSELIKAKCPVGAGVSDAQCYMRPEDYDTIFGRGKFGAEVCPESMGKDNCMKIIDAKSREQESRFTKIKRAQYDSGVVGYGAGYYGSDLLADGKTLRRWHGIGANLSATHQSLIWGIAALTLSADANLGFGGGIEANAGVGPTFSIGISHLVRGWGSLKVRGNASSGGDSKGYAGYGLNPEAGLSVFFLDFRWIFPSVAGGGDTQQGNGFFAGVSLGLP